MIIRIRNIIYLVIIGAMGFWLFSALASTPISIRDFAIAYAIGLTVKELQWIFDLLE